MILLKPFVFLFKFIAYVWGIMASKMKYGPQKPGVVEYICEATGDKETGNFHKDRLNKLRKKLEENGVVKKDKPDI